MKVGRTIVIALSFFGITSTASAVVFGPSNLGFMGYDEPDCFEPRMPYSVDEYSLSRLRSDVEEYIDCLNEFIEAGDNDIKRIREAQEEARSDADDFGARLDRWIAQQR